MDKGIAAFQSLFRMGRDAGFGQTLPSGKGLSRKPPATLPAMTDRHANRDSAWSTSSNAVAVLALHRR